MKRKLWSRTVGEKGFKVRVFERTPGGVLYARCWDPSLRAGKGGMRKVSLGYRDKQRAVAYAHQQTAKLAQGDADVRSGRTTLARLFTLYLEHRTPRKRSSQERKADARRVEMWTRRLGNDKDPHKITLGEWEAFIDVRRSGAIDARAWPVAQDRRRPVRARSVEADLKWLRWVLNWGARWRDREGRYQLRENPVRGYEIPTEKNPRRPLATRERYEAIRAVSDNVTMVVLRGGKAIRERSYLSELLDIVNGTGRRLSAVCNLVYEDLRLNEIHYGAIRWPADTDKGGREWVVPIAPAVRRALESILRERPGIGRAPLFPAPGDPTKPIDRHVADGWLRRAEKLAGLDPQPGSLWHAFRRKWATERKHLPDVDVAAAGGWKELSSLKAAYQQADQETMLQVVLNAGELREVR